MFGNFLSSSEQSSVIPTPTWIKDGGFMFYLLLLFYVFFSFVLICEEFLMPSLNLLCSRLHVPEDFAGATILGLGTCIPDIFDGIFGVVILHSDVGLGSIVGSLLFNHLFVIGCSVLYAGVLVVRFDTILRETIFYSVTLILLLGFLYDHKITVWESLTLLLLYVVYCVFCWFTPQITLALKRCHGRRKKISEVAMKSVVTPPESPSTTATLLSPEQRLKEASAQAFKEGISTVLKGPLMIKSQYRTFRLGLFPWNEKQFTLDAEFWYCNHDKETHRHVLPLWCAYRVEKDDTDARAFTIFTAERKIELKAVDEVIAEHWVMVLKERIQEHKLICPDLISDTHVLGLEDRHDEADSVFDVPRSKLQRIKWVIGLPVMFLFTVTIPNVKQKFWQKWYVISFINSLAWIGGLSYAMVWAADGFAAALKISDDIMGLTITAFGTSLPSLFPAMIAAKQGSNGMAVSSTFGANMSSILVAMGLPFFIQTAMVKPGQTFLVESESIVTTVATLLFALIVFLVITVACKFRITKPAGAFYVFLYLGLLAVVVILAILNIKF